ncbi:hypothetical protein CPAV1605_1202 [seawater metagenome]|uniref:Uncharacterized protein n=1 Tax=seawater metagenome TaxID=1561972 RepID=A0A5E8CJI8_9ZZZZ
MLKINNLFNEFQKNRDIILNNKVYMSIVIYLVILFIIDYSGCINLYGQNIIRRCINMYRRLDPLNYKNKLKPFCKKYDKILDENDIIQLQSIKIPEIQDIGTKTRKNTTTHECCKQYSKTDIKIIKGITEKIRQKYEKKIQKKLYYIKTREATIYRYYGNNSHHLWHVDPQNLTEIYNIIICIQKKGKISPLQCKDKEGAAYSIHFEEGDAALFNGGTTVHQVPPNDDPNSERTVLSLAFTSDKKLSQKNDSKNMCVYIEGGNNYVNIFKIVVLVFSLNWILTKISGTNRLSYKYIFVFLIINLLISKYIPSNCDIGLGTGRASSISHNFVILFGFIATTISIKGGMLLFSYFLISDVFFSRKWVAYN